jgi:hypothetical protein
MGKAAPALVSRRSVPHRIGCRKPLTGADADASVQRHQGSNHALL